MRTLETNAEYYGISLLQLMENAGRSIATEVASHFPKGKRVAIFCGLGGNGGDGFVAARHLSSLGFEVIVVLAGKGKDISHEAALRNWESLQFLSGNITICEVRDSSTIPRLEADIIVDALLGTGTKGRLKAPVSQSVDYMNSLSGYKIAVDAPTGIDSDTGEILGTVFKADTTVTFHAPKVGLAAAKKYVGELIVKDIGLPRQLENFAGPGDVILVTRRRALSAHKGDFGRLLVVGGSEVYSGAPSLVSLAALRTGADIVYTAAPAKTSQAISSISPDLITIKLEGNHLKPRNVEELEPYVEATDAVVVGPGLGLDSETKEFVKLFMAAVEKTKKPLLIDADGLKAFAEFKRPAKVPLVLTPHAGEYTVLTKSKLPEDQAKRVSDVQATAAELNAVILLKGQTDIVCSGEKFKLNFTGNPGMTVGGTGDVLSGIVGALLAQETDAFEAAVAGAFVNGATGDFVADKLGHHMVASDLLEYIPCVLEDPMSHLKVRKFCGNLA